MKANSHSVYYFSSKHARPTYTIPASRHVFYVFELNWWEKTIYKNTEFVELKIYWLLTPSGVEANLFQLCFIGGKRCTLIISKWEWKTQNKITTFVTADHSPALGDREIYDLKVCWSSKVIVMSVLWSLVYDGILAGDNHWAIM